MSLHAHQSLIHGTATKSPYHIRFTSHPRYSVAPRAPYEFLLRHSRKMRTRQGAHFFVEEEEEKKGGPLRQKFILGKDEFPTYTCLKMCSNDTLPQGSAACAARRLRLFPRLERGVKSAKMFLIQSSILMGNIPPPSACPPPRSLFRRALRSLRIPPPTIRFTPLNSAIALQDILLLFMPRC